MIYLIELFIHIKIFAEDKRTMHEQSENLKKMTENRV